MKKFLKIAVLVAVVLAVATWCVFQLPQFGGTFEGERLARMQRSPEFINGRFQNVPPQQTDNSLRKMYRLYTQGQIREPQFAVPVLDVSLERPPSRELQAVWLGHASVLVELDGVRILTDPVLSDYASPVPPLGPKRLHRPPIAIPDLKSVDAVVISHDHYDHLDLETTRQLARNGTHFFVPLGVGAHLERWHVPSAQIHEMDWWESTPFQGITIHCTPTRHYSGRKRMDNSTLWSSWFIKGTRSVYFSGDTGYAPHFREIRRRLGAVDLTLLKVGAYGETWLDIHMDPESAVRAHRDLGGHTMLPVHWATFNLSYHAWEEPIVRTLAAAQREHIDVITPRPGEPYAFGRPFRNTDWFRRLPSRASGRDRLPH
ncbi:MAG TPA: MBL fold metallo-hydrolase [Thermoanaerobaculia bacterium]|nr:MBL fold metallo-hydrolase [Thermoanaerobaculia bacterium]